jgi:hypothetical protein
MLLKLGPEMRWVDMAYRVLPVAALPLVLLIWVQVARVWVHKSLMAKLKMVKMAQYTSTAMRLVILIAPLVPVIWTLPYTVG